MVCTVKSERIIRATQYAIQLYPSAVYHLVAVIPKMRSRYFLTSLYHETMQKIMEDALHDVELALVEKGVMTVRKVVLKGNPVKKLVEYASKNPIDMIVLSTSRNEMVPIGVIGSTARRIIVKTDVPVLVYTPLSPSENIVVNKILVLPIEAPHERIELIKEILSDLSKRTNASITIYDGFSEEASELLKNKLNGEKIDCRIIKRRIEKPQDLIGLLEEHDLIIIPRCKKGITQKVKITLFKTVDASACVDMVVVGLSPRPVILV